MHATSNPLPANVLDALQAGNKIEAIRLLREATGLGLKEAKDWVDASPPEVQLKTGMDAPGEVSRSGSLVGYVVAAVVVAALLAYYFLRSPG